MIIHCMDFRLGSAIRNELARRGVLDDCDIVSLAGAGKAIVSGEPQSWHDTAFDMIGLSKKLHGTKTLILMHHTDCGAYGGRSAFDSLEAEREKHVADMKKAKEIIGAQHPDLEIKLALAHIEPAGIRFEDVN
jgi:carbonic anhydrase